MITYNWQEFLPHMSRALLQDPRVVAHLPPEVVASGWLGYPGATEAQLVAAETRLGTTLPPDYRSFLSTTNGWRQINTLDPELWPLWSTEEIEWFRVRHQDWIDTWTWTKPDGALPSVPGEQYFVYGDQQETGFYRPEYLPTTLEISDIANFNSAVYLLNPQVVTADGEWEAWFLATWNPGVSRYRSFWEMMQDLYTFLVKALDEERQNPAFR